MGTEQNVWKVVQKFAIAFWVGLIASLLLPSFFLLAGVDAAQVDVASPAQSQIVQSPGNAIDWIQTGQEHYQSEQFLAAAQALQQAADRYSAQDDFLRQAQALGLQALAWEKLGDWNSAQTAIEQSLSLLERPHSSTDEVNRIRAQVLNAQGHLQLGLGQTARSLESWIAAEEHYRQANAEAAVLGVRINQTQALQSLGFYRRAETLLNQLESELTPLSDGPIKVKGLLNLGNVLRLGGEVMRAQAVLQQGLEMAQRLQRPADEGLALMSLGNTERVLASRAAAIRDTEESDAQAEAAILNYQAAQAVSPNAMTQVQAQLNQLSLWVEKGQLELARPVRSRLFQAIDQLPVSRSEIYARVNLAQISIDMFSEGDAVIAPEEMAAIAQHLATAVEQARTLADKRAESYALGALGKLYEITDDRDSAQTTTKAALALAQEIRAPDIVYQWQWQMGRLLRADATIASLNNKVDADTQTATTAVGYYTAAVDTLDDLRSDLVALNPDIQFSFREQVEPVYRELIDLLLQAESPGLEQLKQARNVMEALQLAELDNFFRDACAQPETVNIDTVDASAAVVYPILLKDRLAVILKLPGNDNLRYATQAVREEQVDAAVRQLLSGLKRRSMLPAELKAESQQLYRWLLEPFAADLEQTRDREQSTVKTLVFVLDGSLRNVPMSTIYDGQQYLIERYAIALTPGLQLLAPKSLRSEQLKVLVAGATDAPSFEASGLNALDNVAFEIAGVEGTINNVTRLDNENFLQEAVREQLKTTPFDVVHFATHGNFSSNPEQTFLLDWEGRISANDIDTLFKVNDPSQEGAVELLVLSACETAEGDKRAALGLAGIAIRADVRSTLATLWQVNDASTAEFMVRFYEQLSSGTVTKSEALRNVQMSFLSEYEGTDYNRPFHWAPFTLVGNWL